jgi:hypothetical protein
MWSGVIDRLREQIQQRLEQLTHESRPPSQGARRARPALIRSARERACRTRAYSSCNAEAEGFRDEERTGPANGPFGGSLSSPDGAGGD